MSKGCFLPHLIDLLKETDYVEVSALQKRCSEWTALDDKEIFKPFLDWFVSCVTFDNCLTTDEVVIYRELKFNGKLVPEEELDLHLQEYINIESCSDISQFHTNFDQSAKDLEKELHALTSLEKFLNEQEKKVEMKKKASDEIDPFINMELNELEKLNSSYNEALNKYVHAWEDLKSLVSQEHSKELCLNKYLNMIFLNNRINQNLNEHMKNDFQEIKPSDGKICVSSFDYWIVHQKLSEVRNDIINTTAELHGKSLIITYLNELERLISINPDEISHSDIEKFLNEVPNPEEKLTEVLSVFLEDELNCLVKIQLNDSKKVSGFLEDRFDRLTKIENILQNKRILNDALRFIIKRDKAILDCQLNTLTQFSKNIELLGTQHEQRVVMMKNHESTHIVHTVDPNYKAMMKCRGVQNSDYTMLAAELKRFKETLDASYVKLHENLHTFQKRFNERLKEIKKVDKELSDGPTREMFGHMFNGYMADIKENVKRQKKIIDTFAKIKKMYDEVRSDKSKSKRECIWIECLENPKNFLKRLCAIEKETEQLRERVKAEVMNQI